jgi:electron transport complex protein RnfA
MGNYFALIIGAVFVNNFLLVQFLGVCPFLGVSKKSESALGMGIAVVFVMTIAAAITYPLYNALLAPLGLDYLKTLVFILVIAALVQMVEVIIKRLSPALYSALGVYLPLLTTNCAILGVALLLIGGEIGGVQIASLFEAISYAFFAGVGFTLAIFLLSGIRDKLDKINLPKIMKGFPITLIAVALMAMAFQVFS